MPSAAVTAASRRRRAALETRRISTATGGVRLAHGALEMRLPFLPLLAPLLLAACSYSKNVPASTNGSESVLFFSQVTAANLGVVPIGVSRTVTVWRNSGGTVECHGLGTGSARDVSIQGGGKPDLPSDTCGSIAAEQVTLESATCDDDACTITSEDKGNSIVLHVAAKSKEAKASRLHVALKKESDAATVWHDSIAVSFAPADRVELTGSFADLAVLRLPILTGVTFTLPIARVVDANDKEMSIDDDTLKETSNDNGVIGDNPDPYAFNVIAKKPGKASVKWELPGAIERTVEIEVVDRTEARSLALFAATVSKDPAALSTDLDTLTADELSPKDGLESIAFTTYAGARSAYSTRVRLADGRSALAPIDGITVEPATLARPDLASADWALTLSTPSSKTATSGTGTVTLEAAGLTQIWPITVTPGKAQK
jgi:hypothetical protein